MLDSDATNDVAAEGIRNIQSVLNNYTYFSENTKAGMLELKKGRLILTSGVGPTLYELGRIFELGTVKKSFFSSEECIQFKYDGVPQRRVSLQTGNPNKWFIVIEDAKMGKYPEMTGLGNLYQKIS